MSEITYSIDSRLIKPGDVFVAIQGENFNGHDFIGDVIKKGVKTIVIENTYSKLFNNIADINIIKTINTIEYLAIQAKKKLNRINPQVIAITGSVGKTSTKNIVVETLKQKYEVFSPRKNFNTLLGISLSILNEMNYDVQVLVLEMGTYKIGNINKMCEYFTPNVAVVTNIQPVHLERFGSLENIFIAKSELVKSLDKKGIAFLNFDDVYVRRMKSFNQGITRYYGNSPLCDITPKDVSFTSEMIIQGDHRISLAMVAYSIGNYFNIVDDELKNAIIKCKPIRGRLNILNGINGSKLVDDTYNAAFSSMEIALNYMENFKIDKKIAFLGDMLELGDFEHKAHSTIVKMASGIFDKVFFIGPRFYGVQNEICNKTQMVFQKDTHEVLEKFNKNGLPEIDNNTVILFKGSQGMRIEKIIKLFLDKSIPPEKVLVRQEKSWQD